MALQGQPRSFLGIDITSTHISLVELINRGPRIELATYALADIPTNFQWEQSRQKKDSVKQIAGILSQVMNRANTSADAVIFSLPNSEIFSTCLSFPSMSDKELSAAVRYKAKEMIPINLDDMVITATRSGTTRQNIPLQSSPHQPIAISQRHARAPSAPVKVMQAPTPFLINAIPTTLIRWYKNLAQELSLDLVALEAEIFPMLRVHPITDTKSTLFIKVNKKNISLYVADMQAVRLVRTIDNEEAPHNPDILLGELDQLTNAHTSNNLPPLKHVFLVGHGALNDLWSKALDSYWAIPTTISQPFSGLAYPQGVERNLTKQGPLFTVAIGLAGRQIVNL